MLKTWLEHMTSLYNEMNQRNKGKIFLQGNLVRNENM